MQRGFKYAVKLTILSSFLLVPFSVEAACSADGYTVIFVNGVWDSKRDTQVDISKLQERLGNEFNGQKIKYTVGYNQTHIAGAGDLLETYFPALDQFDLDTILRQIHDEVQTRKLLIVGHSQGAVYANKIYEYLVTHGVPKESVAVYAVATPDSYVAGNGKYITYTLDDIINVLAQTVGMHPLPANVNFEDLLTYGASSTAPVNGHSFIDEYLAGFGPRISSDIKTELFLLRSIGASDTGSCFTPPEDTFGHRAAAAGLTVTDFYATAMAGIARQGYGQALAISSAGQEAYAAARNMFGAVASIFVPQPISAEEAAAKERAANDAGVALMHSLNLTSLSAADADQLQRDAQKKKKNNGLGAAAILALEQGTPQGEVLGTTTESTSSEPAPVSSVATFPLEPEPPKAMPGEVVIPHGPTPNPSPDDQPSPVAEAALSAPFVLLPPQNVALSNVSSPANTDDYCSVMNRNADISWDPVPGATGYQVWQSDPLNGERPMLDTTSTQYPQFDFQFGLNWATPITLKIVALDGAGQYATTSLLANDAVPDKDSPSIELISPAIGSTNVPLDTSFKLTYNEPLDRASITNRFSLVRINYPNTPSSEPVEASVSLEGDDKTVDIVPVSLLLPGERYNLVTSCRVKDLYGNHAGVLDTDISFNSAHFATATTSGQ